MQFLCCRIYCAPLTWNDCVGTSILIACMPFTLKWPWKNIVSVLKKIKSFKKFLIFLNVFLTKFYVCVINVCIISEWNHVGRTPGRQLYGKLVRIIKLGMDGLRDLQFACISQNSFRNWVTKMSWSSAAHKWCDFIQSVLVLCQSSSWLSVLLMCVLLMLLFLSLVFGFTFVCSFSSCHFPVLILSLSCSLFKKLIC